MAATLSVLPILLTVFRFVAVVLSVQFCRLARVVGRVVKVAVGRMSVVCRRFMITGGVMFACFPVVLRGILVMFRRLRVMIGCFFRHASLLLAFEITERFR